MKRKAVLFNVLLLSVSMFGVNAQVLDSYMKSKARTATNRVGQNADKEVDNQINKAVDKEFNKIKDKILEKDDDATAEPVEAEGNSESVKSTDNSSKSSKSSGDDAMSKALMGKMGINMERPANMKDSYDYTGNIKMDIESWNYEGESEGVVAYTTQYSEKDNGFAMEFKDEDNGYSTIIFDYDNQLMLILTDNGTDKSGFASTLSPYQEKVEGPTENEEPANVQTGTESENIDDYYSSFKKTGKSKTIAGYKCDEYYYEDEEDMISYWMTSDIPADLWAKVGSSSAFASLYTGRTNGYVMESDQRKKTSKEKSHMIVKEVNKNAPAKISTVGYTVMTMNITPAASEETEK